MRVAYFTAGTVGAGHLVRGLAVGRALARAGFTGSYRAFGPPVPYPVVARLDYAPVPLVEAELRDPARAPASAIATALRDYAPDLLLVDLFWAPLRHVLPTLATDAWLLVRSCPRAWFTGPADTRWDATQYRRIVAIEPFRHPVLRETIDPIVICNPDELRSPSALRERLGVAPDRRLVVVAHAGLAGEVMELSGDADDETVVCDLFAEDALFPLAEWLAGADVVHCAAGYNAFWEAQWLGWAARTRFTPLRRTIDDQAWRATTCRGWTVRANGADTLARQIVAG